jgi:membrane protein DedA with SNARE-associated domain
VLSTLTTSLTTIITNLYLSTGLLGIVLAMAIESCCIPLPSEIVMPIAGILLVRTDGPRLLAGTNFWLGIFLVALAGAFGCLIGSIVAYGIGYKGGRPLMLRYGRYVLISAHDADKADAFFQRWGSPTAFFSRLLPVVRTYISLPAGITKMPFVKFCVYTFLGSLPWSFALAYLGTVIGKNLDTLSPIFHSLDIVILVVLVILIVLYVWRHIRNDRNARAAHVVAEASAQSGMQQQPPQGWNQSQQPVQQPQQPWGQSQSPQQPQTQPWGQGQPQQPQWGQNQPPQQPQWGQSQSPQQPPRR